jgi:hypothetical protein
MAQNDLSDQGYPLLLHAPQKMALGHGSTVVSPLRVYQEFVVVGMTCIDSRLSDAIPSFILHSFSVCLVKSWYTMPLTLLFSLFIKSSLSVRSLLNSAFGRSGPRLGKRWVQTFGSAQYTALPRGFWPHDEL